MYCHDCAYFTELGECRHPKVSRRDHAYFEKACGNFEDKSENTQPETTQEMKEEKTITTAVCKDCGRELPLEEFQKGPHGYMNYCKECFKKRQKAGKQGPKPPKPIKVDIDPRVAEAIAAPSKVQEALDKKVFESAQKTYTTAEIFTIACGMESEDIIWLIRELAAKLEERGYEVTGTICHKIEI